MPHPCGRAPGIHLISALLLGIDLGAGACASSPATIPDGAAATGSGGAAGSGGASATGGAASGGTSGGTGGGSSGGSGTAGASGFGVGGPSRCASANVKLCEDFESGLNSSTWKITKNGDTTIAVDATRAARGASALHIKTTAGDWAYIKETKTFPATANILYGRMFVYFEDDLTTDGHFSLAEGAGTGTPGVARFGGQYKVFGVGTDGGPSGDWTDKDDMTAAGKKVPSKTWICAEFEFKGDTHEFRVWWDDAERAALRTGPARHANFTMPAFNSLWFGWWMYNIKEPQELWIDEIAVDFQPIGCSK